MKKLLSFNAENEDVYHILNTKRNASQYVCDAVRFYETNKDLTHNMSGMANQLSRIEKTLNQISLQAKNNPSVIPGNETTWQVDNDLKHTILNEED